MTEDFKGNSNASQKNQVRVSTVKPVTNNVIVKNNDSNEKPKKRFFAENAKSVNTHIFNSVLLPSLQKLVTDIVKTSIDFLIYGSKAPMPRSGPGTVSYSSYYDRTNNSLYSSTSTYTNPMLNKPTVYAVNEVIFNDIGEAEEVLLRMKESIKSYSMVSVADFYDLIGQRCSFTDQKYGWYDLRNAEVLRIGNGYSIRFPKVQALE